MTHFTPTFSLSHQVISPLFSAFSDFVVIRLAIRWLRLGGIRFDDEATRTAVLALWSITVKNKDCSTGPLARPFARLLAPLTRSLAPDCSLRSRPPLRSLVCSLAHFAHSLARGKVYFSMSQYPLFLTHSAMASWH